MRVQENSVANNCIKDNCIKELTCKQQKARGCLSMHSKQNCTPLKKTNCRLFFLQPRYRNILAVIKYNKNTFLKKIINTIIRVLAQQK
jgi:hypothetical protein